MYCFSNMSHILRSNKLYGAPPPAMGAHIFFTWVSSVYKKSSKEGGFCWRYYLTNKEIHQTKNDCINKKKGYTTNGGHINNAPI